MLECVPDGVARMVTDAVDVPTIGIGAGRHCDGQVLVFHDLLGLEDRMLPEVRAPLRRAAGRSRPTAVEQFVDDVRTGTLPVERGDVPHDRPDGLMAFDLVRREAASVAVPPGSGSVSHR